jgi:Flp pilus assembly protein TadG
MRKRLISDQDGATALEFALVAPVLIAMIFGIAQFGIIFFANAGLNNALAEGARLATLYPRPTETQILDRIEAKRWGLEKARLTVSPIDWGTSTSNGSAYARLSMSYSVPINAVFFELPPITLRESRRVYVQPMAPGAS